MKILPFLSPSAALALLCVTFTSVPQIARAQGDDFDDGNADGWTELVPLQAVGGTGTFSFPGGNSYRMQSSPSPDEGAAGPSRIGSLREDVTYDDFYISVDVVDYDEALDQNIGLLARVAQPGLGTLDGYGVTYNPTDGAMFLTVITDEVGPNIADTDVDIPSGVPVRLIFQGKGADLKLEVFRLDDLETVVASIEVNDSTYSSGNCGMFVVTDTGDPPKPTDCTFDNYFAASEEPVEFRITDVQIVGDDIAIEFLSKPGAVYALWFSVDMKAWEELDDGIDGALSPTTTTSTPKPSLGRMFYQIRRVSG